MRRLVTAPRHVAHVAHLDIRSARRQTAGRVTRFRFLLCLLPPVVVGSLLRFHRLGEQVLLGDELHAVRAVSAMPLGEILTTYAERDHGLPLAGFYRAASSLGPIDETVLRAPVLIAGLLLLVLAPWLLRKRIGAPAAVLLAWLVAVSPALTLYSRIARPYMPVVLLSFLAVIAFHAWLESGARSSAVAYAVCASLAMYTHLVSAPFVLAPFVFLAGAYLTPLRSRLPPLARAIVLGLLTLVLILVWLLPSAPSLIELVSLKRGRGAIDPTALPDVLRLQLGTRALPIAAMLAAAAVLGWIRLLQRDAVWGSYVLTVLVVNAIGLVLLSPQRFGEPIILSRYLLLTLPFTLAGVAMALAPESVAVSTPVRWVTRGLVAAAVVALVATGPFVDPVYARSSFVHHNDFVDFTKPKATRAADAIPGFYLDLAHESGTAAIIEAPCDARWDYTRAYYVYQGVHGRPVRLSCPSHASAVDFRRFRPKTLLPPTPEAFLASGAEWVVVHDDLPGEEADTSPPRVGSALDVSLLRGAAASLSSELRTAWGPPDVAADTVEVWDLRRVRGG